MLGLFNTKVFGLRVDIPLGGAIEGDMIISGFGEERVLDIDYNRANKAILISRVQEDSEGIVKRTISLKNYYPVSLSGTDIEVLYNGQGDYDRCNEILERKN